MSDNKLTIREYIAAPQVQKKMAEMFSSDRLLKQFTQSVIALAGSDELLAVAEPRSVFNACMTAASLDLPINKSLGFAHIIGYKNNRKGIVEAQFQIGAKGLKQLAQRTGQYRFINESDVREGELIKRDRLSGDITFSWTEDDDIRNKLPIIGYVSFFELKSDFKSILYMTAEEIEAHARQYSQAYKYDLSSGKQKSPWSTDRDGMSRKTVMKLNINRNGPMSTELERAIEADQAVIDEDDKPVYVDNQALEDERASADQKAAIIKAQQDAAAPESQETVYTDAPADIDTALDEVVSPTAAQLENIDAIFAGTEVKPKTTTENPNPKSRSK